jgi:uncharacterized protein YqgC (DUF456 family)
VVILGIRKYYKPNFPAVQNDCMAYAKKMGAEQIIGLILALLVMVVGLAGSIVPVIPSTPLVLLAAVGHKIYFGPTGVGWVTMLLLGLLTIFSLVVDYVASIYGAKRLGATTRGAWGAVIGALVGLFFSLPGVLLGPFVGAFAFELAGGRHVKESSLAGLGATLGFLAGVLGRVVFCLAMMITFTVNVLYRSFNVP